MGVGLCSSGFLIERRQFIGSGHLQNRIFAIQMAI